MDYLEQEATIGVSYDYLTDQFRTGRSPSRKKLRKALDNHYQTIKYSKNKEFGSVHKGCCMCTAELISGFLLSQEMNKFQRNIQPCIDWLNTHEKENWAVHYEEGNDADNRKNFFSYTGYALTAYMDLDDKDRSKKAAEHLITICPEWKEKIKDVITSDSTGTYGRLFLSLSRYINCIEHVEDIEKLFDEQSIIKSFLKKLLNNKDNFQKSEKYKILPFLLIWKRTEILPAEFKPEQLKHEACNIANSISDDFMWGDGSWAHNSRETLYRIRALLFFWEYFLSDETTSLDEYYNIVNSQSSYSSDPKQKEDI